MCEKTFPGTDRRVIPLKLEHSIVDPLPLYSGRMMPVRQSPEISSTEFINNVVIYSYSLIKNETWKSHCVVVHYCYIYIYIYLFIYLFIYIYIVN